MPLQARRHHSPPVAGAGGSIARMGMRILQFAAVLLTALALVPGGAHVLEMAAKLRFDRDTYLAAQQVYRGWAWLGAVLIGALLANAVLAFVARHQRSVLVGAAAAAVLLALSLVVFFAWTFPVNQATANWTLAPADWERLRRQWEFSHAVNAAITLVALCASIAATLAAPLRR